MVVDQNSVSKILDVLSAREGITGINTFNFDITAVGTYNS
jgi:hypothetical protein